MKAINEIKKDDIMGEAELNIYSLIEDLEALDKKERFWQKHRVIDFEGL